MRGLDVFEQACGGGGGSASPSRTPTGQALPDTRYVCSCHGSTFDRDGRVLVGPATAALRSFPSTFAGTVLVVAL